GCDRRAAGARVCCGPGGAGRVSSSWTGWRCPRSTPPTRTQSCRVTPAARSWWAPLNRGCDHVQVIVEAHGGSRGNPGPAGYGAVVLDADGERVLAERKGGLGVTTNNVAEYTGLIEGLRAAAELGATRVDVRMDSKLVVEQMCGRWKIKHPSLQPLA